MLCKNLFYCVFFVMSMYRRFTGEQDEPDSHVDNVINAETEEVEVISYHNEPDINDGDDDNDDEDEEQHEDTPDKKIVYELEPSPIINQNHSDVDNHNFSYDNYDYYDYDDNYN